MNANERELLEGLRALAFDGPRQAPAQIEARLVNEFRRRIRRRRNAWWSLAGAGAIAAALAVFGWMGLQQPRSPALAEDAVASAEEAASGFYPVPEADALPPVESALVVRVQLPMESLRVIGVPINEGRATERVEAEVLLGQDGLARGVRLVE